MTTNRTLVGAAMLACAASHAATLPYTPFLNAPLERITGATYSQPFSITEPIVLGHDPIPPGCGLGTFGCDATDTWLLRFQADIPITFTLNFDGISKTSGPLAAGKTWEVAIWSAFEGALQLTYAGGSAVPNAQMNVYGIMVGVPEPSTYALALLGLGSIAWRARRRQAATVIPKLS